MSDKLIQGGEVMQAVAASALRANEVGHDEAIVELGFEPKQLRMACSQQAEGWIRQVAVSPTVGDLMNWLASAECEGVIAGIRLGRMYAPLPPAVVERLESVEAELTLIGRALGGHVGERIDRVAGQVHEVLDATGALS